MRERHMWDGIEALLAVRKCGSMSEAAARLRVSQPTVSKRIKALQGIVGYPVVRPDGRRVRLTEAGVTLLERAQPLLADWRALAGPSLSASGTQFSVALADSIAASWGPLVVKRALAAPGTPQVTLHAHRAVLLVEQLRLGRYHIGVSTDIPAARDLLHFRLVDEPMVLIQSDRTEVAPARRPVVTIEPASATWRAVERVLREAHPALFRRERIGVESFSAAVQMVKAGFADGLAPLGLARECGFGADRYRPLRGVTRSVVLLARKGIAATPAFQKLKDALASEASTYFRALGVSA